MTTKNLLMTASAAGGGGITDPLDITGCTAWFDASDTATITDAGAGAVSQWDDKSGNARHLTQTSSTERPTTGTQTINSLNVIRFDGGNDQLEYLTAAQYVDSSTGAWSAFAVIRKTSNSGTDLIAAGVRTGEFSPQYLRTSGTTLQSVASDEGTYTTDSGGTVGTAAVVVSAVQTATTIECWLAGVSGGSTAIGGTPLTTTSLLYLGRLGNVNEYMAGDIAEFVLYDSALGTTDREAVEDYLTTKWGL